MLLPNNTCESNCLTGTYNLSNICVSCPVNCTTCDSTGCITCNANTYLFGKQCVDICPYGYYMDELNIKCELCQSPCLYCSIKSNNCSLCDKLSINNKYLHINTCINKCPSTYYSD